MQLLYFVSISLCLVVAGSRAVGKTHYIQASNDHEHDLDFLAVLFTPGTLVFCPRQPSAGMYVATFTCMTTNTGALLWIQGNQQYFFTSSSMVGDTGPLGMFTTRLDSAEGLNLTSTATTDVFSLPSNISNITIMCDDNGDTIGAESAVLILLGKCFVFL